MKTQSLYIIICISLVACSKGTATEKDTELPIITLNNPFNNQTYTAGQLITISGTITDNKFIAEAHIHVNNTNTGALIMDVHLYPGNNSTTFNQSLAAVADINYKIQVIAKDRAPNETMTSVNISCN